MKKIAKLHVNNSNYLVQDLLREKQNHIEQLILERDLTRQQTENDTMVFQKEIRQVILVVWFLSIFFPFFILINDFSPWIEMKKASSPVLRKSDSSDHGQWADLIRRRNVRLSELKRELRGWQGTHEQHCILHDVLMTK